MFQSTHPRRVRPCQYTGTCTFQRFNPRTHAGCDHPCGYSYAIELCFNPRTHAGCDSACCCLSRWLHCFNPRTHAGCDCIYRSSIWDKSCFNPRTHAGCDLMITSGLTPASCFNPRTHAGCDVSHFHPYRPMTCFNPRTQQGATQRNQPMPLLFAVSIHAPTQGATKLPVPFVNPVEFQSTHPRRVRLNICFIGTRI